MGERSWKQAARRESGVDGYQFGDLTRWMFARKGEPEEGSVASTSTPPVADLDSDDEARGNAVADDEGSVAYKEASGAKEALAGGPVCSDREDGGEADREKYTVVQRLVHDAVAVYKARGYAGTISVSSTIAFFNESVSVRLDGSGWQDRPLSDADEVRALDLDSRVGRLFTRLLQRLEHRASSWATASVDDDFDVLLGASASLGLAVPIIRIGWGVSISLAATKRTLLRWAGRDGATPHRSLLARPREGEVGAEDEDHISELDPLAPF